MLVKFSRGLWISAASIMEMAAISPTTIVVKTRDGQFHSLPVDEGKDAYQEVDDLANQVNWARAS